MTWSADVSSSRNNFVYGGHEGLLDILDVGDPVHSQRLGRLDFGGHISDLAVPHNEYAYVVVGGQMVRIAIRIPATPVVNRVYEIGRGIQRSRLQRQWACATGADGLVVFDIDTPEFDPLASYQGYSGRIVQVVDSLIYLANGSSGFSIFELITPRLSIERSIDNVRVSWLPDTTNTFCMAIHEVSNADYVGPEVGFRVARSIISD